MASEEGSRQLSFGQLAGLPLSGWWVLIRRNRSGRGVESGWSDLLAGNPADVPCTRDLDLWPSGVGRSQPPLCQSPLSGLPLRVTLFGERSCAFDAVLGHR